MNDWQESVGAVSGQSLPGGGSHSVADPRLGRKAHSNVYRVVRFDEPMIAVTSSRDGAVADPRPEGKDGYTTTKYKVTPYDCSSRTVIGASTTGDGAFAVADPRPAWGNDRHRNILRVTPYEEPAGTIAGNRSITGGQACVADRRREHYQTGGHYGVVGWEQTGYAVSGSACHDNGFNSVADPRDHIGDVTEKVTLPAPNDRLVCRIVAPDGTWHRPFTTLDLGALQSLIEPEEIFYQEATEEGSVWRCITPFDLIDGSDVTKREWIGNMVPGAAATGVAQTIGETIMLAEQGETFMLSNRDIWVKPGALALSIDNDQAAFRWDVSE